MDEVRTMVVNILRLVGSRLTPRDAIILLLQAGLNAALAVQQFAQQRNPRIMREIEEAQEPRPKEKSKGKESLDPVLRP